MTKEALRAKRLVALGCGGRDNNEDNIGVTKIEGAKRKLSPNDNIEMIDLFSEEEEDNEVVFRKVPKDLNDIC